MFSMEVNEHSTRLPGTTYVTAPASHRAPLRCPTSPSPRLPLSEGLHSFREARGMPAELKRCHLQHVGATDSLNEFSHMLFVQKTKLEREQALPGLSRVSSGLPQILEEHPRPSLSGICAVIYLILIG